MDKETNVPAVPLNRKMNVVPEGSCDAMPRVTHRKARGFKSARFLIRCGCRSQSFEIHYKSARFLIRCGCCSESFEIHYSDFGDPVLAGLEIAGVNSCIENWRAIFLPLLGFKREGNAWVDTRSAQTSTAKELE